MDMRLITRGFPNAKGFALIISNDYKNPECGLLQLPGAQKDSTEMKVTFKYLKFAVHCIHNASGGELVSVLASVARHIYPSSYRRIAVVFSGHGTAGYVYSGEGNQFELNTMYQQFSASQHLANIPKMFFIDACRGHERNTPIVVPRGGGLIQTIKVPHGGNFLFAYSTIMNYVSYETSQGGVWMNRLAKELKSNLSICDILTKINSELIKMYNCTNIRDLQQPTFNSQLNEIVNLYDEAYGRTASATTKPSQGETATSSPKPSQRERTNQGNRVKIQALTGHTARDKLEHYAVSILQKPVPSYKVESTEEGLYIGVVYVAMIGRTTGSPQKTKEEAKENAAIQCLAKIEHA